MVIDNNTMQVVVFHRRRLPRGGATPHLYYTSRLLSVVIRIQDIRSASSENGETLQNSEQINSEQNPTALLS